MNNRDTCIPQSFVPYYYTPRCTESWILQLLFFLLYFFPYLSSMPHLCLLCDYDILQNSKSKYQQQKIHKLTGYHVDDIPVSPKSTHILGNRGRFLQIKQTHLFILIRQFPHKLKAFIRCRHHPVFPAYIIKYLI